MVPLKSELTWMMEYQQTHLEKDSAEVEHSCPCRHTVSISALNCASPCVSEMDVEAIDFMKDYVGERRYLRAAVRITDEVRHSVVWSTVHLMASGPDCQRIVLSSVTDFEGFAHFNLGEVSGGRWTFKVTGVDHPCYRLSASQNPEKWRSVTV